MKKNAMFSNWKSHEQVIIFQPFISTLAGKSLTRSLNKFFDPLMILHLLSDLNRQFKPLKLRWIIFECFLYSLSSSIEFKKNKKIHQHTGLALKAQPTFPLFSTPKSARQPKGTTCQLPNIRHHREESTHVIFPRLFLALSWQCMSTHPVWNIDKLSAASLQLSEAAPGTHVEIMSPEKASGRVTFLVCQRSTGL